MYVYTESSAVLQTTCVFTESSAVLQTTCVYIHRVKCCITDYIFFSTFVYVKLTLRYDTSTLIVTAPTVRPELKKELHLVVRMSVDIHVDTSTAVL